jgi:tetratricopeptide (TPR) repeat protein
MAGFDALWDYADPAATEARLRAHEAQGAEALELRTQIARALGLQRKFAEGHAELDAVDRSDSADARVRIRSALERGRLHNSSGDKANARRSFETAWTLAVEAQEENLAIDAAHMIAIAAPAESIDWNRRALALAAAAKDPKARAWRGSLLNNLGWSYHDMKDYPMALALFEDAIAFRKEQGKADEIRVAEWCFARTLRSLGRHEEALAIQERLESEGTEDGFVSEELGELLLLLGRSAEARAKFARAHQLLSRDPWLQRDEKDRLDRLWRLASGDE